MLTESEKQAIVEQYASASESTDFNADLVLEVGEKYGVSPNLARQVLKEAGAYEAVKPIAKAVSKRPNKAMAQQALVKAIQDKGVEMSEEDVKMITRMTGKACTFFTKVLAP